MDWKTVGHTQVKSLLQKWLALGEVQPHALLFEGIEGVGKFTLALELAARFSEGQNPDVLEVSSELGVDEVRASLNLWGQRTSTGKRMIVINNSHRLSVQVTNVLLKFVETPPKGVAVVFVGSGRMLPTLRSRCVVLRFSELSRDELELLARSQSLQVTHGQMGYAGGSYGLLQQIVQDHSLEQSVQRLEHLLVAATPAPVWERLVHTEAIVSVESAASVLRILTNISKKNLGKTAGASRLLKSCLESLNLWDNPGVNKKILWQKILLSV